MRLATSLAAVATLLTTVACNGAAIESSDDELRQYAVADGEHPEVGILTTSKGYCTGTLIGPRTVLTAAHCFGFSSGAIDPAAKGEGSFSIRTKSGHALSVPFHRWRADATVLQIGFDMGIAQLDAPIADADATPATVADAWPEDGDTLTVYGYGRYGDKCSQKDTGAKHKRKDTITLPDGFDRRVTCPGDSGGPYFHTGTSEIVALVKGDGLGVEWVADAVKHRAWILDRLSESESGPLPLD